MYDDVLTRNEDGELSVRVVNATEQSTVVNPNDVYTRDDEGNLAIRVVGGGDSHNKGYFATPQALQEAYPTAEAGDFAIVESTDTVWLWDSDTSAWKDSDQKGQVTSVNNQTGDVTVQETLVNQSNIKSVNGNSLLGSGNLELSTYLPYPNTWTTNGTTKAFCDGIAADTTATEGKAYLGEVTCSDLPASMVNAEVVVEIMDGTTAQDKVIVLTLTSGNTAPYMWKYTYWNGGSNVSGWQTWQEPLVSGTNIKTINGTSLLGSGDITTEAIQVDTMPTASATELGNVYQFIGTTGTYTHGYFYECVSDGQQPATYSWSQTNVQPTPSGLPSQTGNAGKFLTTDGTDASWATITALQNEATKSTGLVVTGKGTANTDSRDGYSVIIGNNISGATNTGGGILIGNSITAGGWFNGVAIIPQTSYIAAPVTMGGAILIGAGCFNTSGKTNGVIIGDYNKIQIGGANAVVLGGYDNTVSADYAIQIGGYRQTNSDANTVKFGNNNGNFEIMSADGTIPTDRFTTTPVADGSYIPTVTISSGVATRSWTAPYSGPANTTVTLAVADWSSNAQTVSVQGVSSSNTVLVAPAPSSNADYVSAGILCTAQATNSLTFTCQTVPSNAITVNVVILG